LSFVKIKLFFVNSIALCNISMLSGELYLIMKKNYDKLSGWTLLELSIVLLIIGILLAGAIKPISWQIKKTRINATTEQLEQIKEALIGFASTTGYLPCPASDTSFGEQDRTDINSNCNLVAGFVPYKDLGLNPKTNKGVLLDSFNQPIIYALNNYKIAGEQVFAKIDGIKNAKIHNLYKKNLLNVCAVSPCNSSTSATDRLTRHLPALLISRGTKRTTESIAEKENIDDDKYFIMQDRQEDKYNDIFVWISVHRLFAAMLQSRRLP
jgi:prepilin-type N-terminal cleavage/methylation domain-containing protein